MSAAVSDVEMPTRTVDGLTYVVSHRGQAATQVGQCERPRRLFATLVPQSWRWAHQGYAWLIRQFWIPCPNCVAWFGGHEWADVCGEVATVPIPRTHAQGAALCPACTCQGWGSSQWRAKLGDDHRRPDRYDGLGEELETDRWLRGGW